MKTKIYLAGSVCAASLAFCIPVGAQTTPTTSTSPAASPETTASPAAQQTARPLPFHGKVSAIDQSAKTFTVGGKQGSHVLKVTENTTITKAGVAGTMTDIVENERVRGTCLKQADGTFEAKTVMIGPPAGENKARKSKKGAAAEEAAPTP